MISGRRTVQHVTPPSVVSRRRGIAPPCTGANDRVNYHMAPHRVFALCWLVTACGRGAPGAPPPEPATTSEPEVTADDIARSPGEPIEQLLMSRFPGVMVTRTANGIAVRIRGTTSLHGSTEPLYVIDDVPIRPGPGGALFGLNPYDIESIRVLTNASETAMYGMRGANGVIVIKTKQP